MSASGSFIIIKGQPKGTQIDWCTLASKGVYDVKFKSSPTVFHYRKADVTILNDCTWHDPKHCEVVTDGWRRLNITDILSFAQGTKTHWRLTFRNGNVYDYLHGTITVTESCLGDKLAYSSFDYLKRIAQTNELGRDENQEGILSAQYEGLNFVDDRLAAACYLNPDKYRISRSSKPQLIYPFGCNASQVRAVENSFTDQISVIQGPPGTGKTQTILNIIANIILQGKTVLVVSNNNSATTNVLEKLNKYGLGFIVAPLGKNENKEAFINNQPTIPQELKEWESQLSMQPVQENLNKLHQIFDWQEQLAQCKQEEKDVALEWEHFKQEHNVKEPLIIKANIKSNDILSLWLNVQTMAEREDWTPIGFVKNLLNRLQWFILNLKLRFYYGEKVQVNKQNIDSWTISLQGLYYVVRLRELNERKDTLEKNLANSSASNVMDKLADNSMSILKSALYKKYSKLSRNTYNNVADIGINTHEFTAQFPVILSTTFSARNVLKEHIYDYIIMDEASQVSVDTGFLALTCAFNAVIVGDSLQLPNVITEQDRLRYDAIFQNYHIPSGYNSSENSFLESVCNVMPDVSQILLREHYRCHPKIINYCNQKFYGGNLLIMTQDHDEDNVLMAVKTVPGMHARGQFNQREIDVVKQEILPVLHDESDIGIITPYNAQVKAFTEQLPNIETATVHKYQGREKDTIIMSMVDDSITSFSDDPNLLNVAVSRAKKRFCIVMSGNKQAQKGNVSDLIDYILYNNFAVVQSKICSVFDYLYEQYSEQRMAFLNGSKKISEYDSENLTYQLLQNILKDHSEFGYLRTLCHIPIKNIIRVNSLLNEEEKKYISHYSTHVDFLIVNHVTKKPVLAVETDGYNYHNETTEQHNRDIMKDHILSEYGLPLLRLSTIGSDEINKVLTELRKVCNPSLAD